MEGTFLTPWAWAPAGNRQATPAPPPAPVDSAGALPCRESCNLLRPVCASFWALACVAALLPVRACCGPRPGIPAGAGDYSAAVLLQDVETAGSEWLLLASWKTGLGPFTETLMIGKCVNLPPRVMFIESIMCSFRGTFQNKHRLFSVGFLFDEESMSILGITVIFLSSS